MQCKTDLLVPSSGRSTYVHVDGDDSFWPMVCRLTSPLQRAGNERPTAPPQTGNKQRFLWRERRDWRRTKLVVALTPYQKLLCSPVSSSSASALLGGVVSTWVLTTDRITIFGFSNAVSVWSVFYRHYSKFVFDNANWIRHFGYFADVSHKLGFGLEVVPALRVLDGKYKLSCKITRFLSLVFIC